MAAAGQSAGRILGRNVKTVIRALRRPGLLGSLRGATFLCLLVTLPLCLCGEVRGASSPGKKPNPAAEKTRNRSNAPADAKRKTPPSVPAKTAAPKPLPETSTMCIEAQSGLVICEQNPDVMRPPASMLKMMLLLLVGEGIHDGKWSVETPITVSKHAQGMGGTQVYLKEGEVIKLDDLMSAMCVASANDAAMAVAEGLWGTEDACKKRMNERAIELGMTHTILNSVHGLPPSSGQESDQTTARDMARLGQFCVIDPMIMRWVSRKELVFRPGEDPKPNTNKLLAMMPDCDGIKTGYTHEAGFCITATARRNDIRLIAVVMGADGKRDRFDMARDLLNQGFTQVSRKRVLAKGDPVGSALRVANCETQQVRLTAAEDLTVVVKNDEAAKLEVKVPETPAFLEAPIAAGTVLAEACVQLEGKELARVALVSPTDLPEAGLRWKLVHTIFPHAEAQAQTR